MHLHQFRRTPILASFALLALAATSVPASAQTELDGNHIDYLAVGPDGTMVGANSRSMRYREGDAGPYSCDVWATDTPVSSFTVRASVFGLLNDIGGTNDGTSLPTIATTSATTVSGRTISWAGKVDSGLIGSGELTVRQVYSFDSEAHHVVQTTTLTNTGGATITSLYYMAHGDPDQGECSIGDSNDTRNDVIRQPSNGGSALAVAATIAAANPQVVLGMGAFDARARADFSPGIADTDVVDAWFSPSDPGGSAADRGMSVAFRFEGLAIGASVTVRVLYVWGSSVEQVTSRFDEASCEVLADAASCSVGGVAGTCHAGGCCRGCWNGTSCVSGDAVAECGLAGAACATCDDGAFCTTGDSCAAGVCVPGTAPTCDDALACTDRSCNEASDTCATTVNGGGCAIDGACVPSGAENPADACLVCDPSSTELGWTAMPSCDLDGDGVPNSVESPGGVTRDTDGDGTVDERDPDDDGDGIATADERVDEAVIGSDVDGDGIPAYLDLDSDGDGSLDSTEGRTDRDADSVPDYLDPGTAPADTDGDGVPDEAECTGQTCPDTDGDGTPDTEDEDDDGDGIPTSIEQQGEVRLGGDVDGDGIPAHLDTDSDGDGTLDQDESADDSDGDGVPDFLDADSPGLDGGRIVGGALCSASPFADGGLGALVVALALVVLGLRRRGAR